MKMLRKGKELVKKYGRKMEVERIKREEWSFEGYGMEMGKMREKEGLKMKNKGRFGVKVKKVIEKGRNLINLMKN